VFSQQVGINSPLIPQYALPVGMCRIPKSQGGLSGGVFIVAVIGAT